MLRKLKYNNQGFTLIELMVVIIILGILATVTVFAVRGITSQGEENACAVELRTVETAIESYYAQNSQNDPADGDLVPTYLKEAPTYVEVDYTASPPTVSAIDPTACG